MMIIGGIVVLAFGFLAIFWPQVVANAFVVVFGLYAIVDGILKTVMAAKAKGAPGRGMVMTMGILGILAGLSLALIPAIGIAVVMTIIGIWLLLRGLVDIVSSFTDRLGFGASRWMLILSGVLWIIVGIIVMCFPVFTASVFTIFMGVIAAAVGVVTIFLGILLRGVETTVRSQFDQLQ
jgi:uncharacterized membrane protein HdeD (DUF308 family)